MKRFTGKIAVILAAVFVCGVGVSVDGRPSALPREAVAGQPKPPPPRHESPKERREREERERRERERREREERERRERERREREERERREHEHDRRGPGPNHEPPPPHRR